MEFYVSFGTSLLHASRPCSVDCSRWNLTALYLSELRAICKASRRAERARALTLKDVLQADALLKPRVRKWCLKTVLRKHRLADSYRFSRFALRVMGKSLGPTYANRIVSTDDVLDIPM